MLRPHEKAHEVFRANTRRLNGILEAIYANDALAPSGLFGHEGPGADILRLAIVFLHSTFEVYLRGLPGANKDKSFNGWHDLVRALAKANIGLEPFKAVRPPLVAFFKRRHQIAHHADLSSYSQITPEGWSIIDAGQFSIWMCAVSAFVCQVEIAFADNQIRIDSATIAYRKHLAVIDAHLEVFRRALTMGRGVDSSPETKMKAFQRFREAWEATTEIMNRDSLSFLTRDELVRYG